MRALQVPLRPGAALAAAALLLAAGCATPAPGPLLEARAAYEDAARDAEVQSLASVELYEAKQAVERAEGQWGAEQDVEETEHLAYLASRRVERARVSAQGAKAMKEAEALARQREQVLLEVRTGEVEKALTAAELRAREAERARAEADAARQAAEEAAEREKKLREELAELQARETERGLVLTLGDVLFDFDAASLKPGAQQNLYRLVTFLRDHADRQLLVEGHTDSVGSQDYNLSLSQRRAESVSGFLTANGVAPERIAVRGYGKGYPVATNDTEAGRQQNRRVEIVILDPGERAQDEIRPLPGV